MLVTPVLFDETFLAVLRPMDISLVPELGLDSLSSALESKVIISGFRESNVSNAFDLVAYPCKICGVSNA